MPLSVFTFKVTPYSLNNTVELEGNQQDAAAFVVAPRRMPRGNASRDRGAKNVVSQEPTHARRPAKNTRKPSLKNGATKIKIARNKTRRHLVWTLVSGLQ
jgi:hypothetical protein